MNKIVALTLLLAIIGCSDETSKKASNATPEMMAVVNAAKAGQSASCDYDQMTSQGVDKLSWEDASRVCQVVSASLGRAPTVGLLRDIAKAVFAFRVTGLKDEPKEIAYQLMNISESRNDTTDQAIFKTVDVAFKCFNGSQGHVTPRDVNINLRASGELAKTLSDKGIFGMCAMIQENKKSRGE